MLNEGINEEGLYIRPHKLVLKTITEIKNRNGRFLDKARLIADSHDGELISNNYNTALTKMLWKCSNENHFAWKATYNSVVLQGSWCPHCFNDNKFDDIPEQFLNENLPLGICKANYLASFKECHCVSTTYKNNTSPLTFKCSNPNHAPFKMTIIGLSTRQHFCLACKKEKLVKNFQPILNKIIKEVESRGGEVLTKEITKKLQLIEVKLNNKVLSLPRTVILGTARGERHWTKRFA